MTTINRDGSQKQENEALMPGFFPTVDRGFLRRREHTCESRERGENIYIYIFFPIAYKHNNIFQSCVVEIKMWL